MRRRCSFFFFNDTATTEIYTLSLHDALPISLAGLDDVVVDHAQRAESHVVGIAIVAERESVPAVDRKSTRLNSSHLGISYAVFCLKKKKFLAVLFLTVTDFTPANR